MEAENVCLFVCFCYCFELSAMGWLSDTGISLPGSWTEVGESLLSESAYEKSCQRGGVGGDDFLRSSGPRSVAGGGVG